MNKAITIYSSTFPAGRLAPNDPAPILPSKVRKMSRRLRKKWALRQLQKAWDGARVDLPQAGSMKMSGFTNAVGRPR
jgi:hypothetical protein